MNTEFIKNNLTISLDWLSFTSFTYDMPNDLIESFGFNITDFSIMKKGMMGYSKVLKLDGYSIYVMFDGSEEMGIHFSCSGTSIPFLLATYNQFLFKDTPFGLAQEVSKFNTNIIVELLTYIKSIGSLTRLDIAIDDIGGKYFSPQQIDDLIKNGQCVSKFRCVQNLKKNKISDYELLGHTVYMGSRQSDIMLRLYDKRLELLSKNKIDVGLEYFRWELELKDERANIVADHIINRVNLGSVAMDIMKTYLRFVKIDSTRRERCSNLDLWNDFINDCEYLSLFIRKPQRSLDAKREWVKRSVMPTIAGIIECDFGALDFIADNLYWAHDRMSMEMKNIVQCYLNDLN